MTDQYASKAHRSSIRQKILQTRRTITSEEAHAAGLKVIEKIKKLEFFSKPKVVGSYLSMGGELSTAPINDYFLEKHTLALPFMNVHERGIMDFYSFDKGDDLIENRYHILEPVNDPEKHLTPDVFDALIVPLVAFDSHGNRMGMGGGYYDRMLKKVSSECLIIGVAYDFQKIDKIPIEPWDKPLNQMVTPTNHYFFM